MRERRAIAGLPAAAGPALGRRAAGGPRSSTCSSSGPTGARSSTSTRFIGARLISDVRAGAGRPLPAHRQRRLAALAIVLVAAVAYPARPPAAGADRRRLDRRGRARDRDPQAGPARAPAALIGTSLNQGDNSYPSGHTTVGHVGLRRRDAGRPPPLADPRPRSAPGPSAPPSGSPSSPPSWHRPSDAVGAYLVCLAVGAAAAILIGLVPDRAAVGAIAGGSAARIASDRPDRARGDRPRDRRWRRSSASQPSAARGDPVLQRRRRRS